MPEANSLADSLQGGVGRDNHTTWPIVRDLVDDVVLVSEDAIWDAMGLALRDHRLVLEGAGAVGIAALVADAVAPDGPTVVVCSGSNVELDHLAALASDHARPDLA